MTTEVSPGWLATALSPVPVSAAAATLDRYSHDAWPLQTKLALLGRHPLRPDLVAFPRSREEVVAVIRIAGREGIAVTARGLGSSVTGQPLPIEGGIVLDLSELRGEPVINEVDRTVRVGAGWNGGDLEALLQARGYTLGHSPQSLHRSSAGGWVATAATGQLSSRYGGIERLVVGLEAVLADGSVIEVGARPRAAMGPDLKALFIGSEGTLGIITQVELKIHQLPERQIDEAFRFANLEDGITAIRQIAQSGLDPALVRLYDQAEARHVLREPAYDGALLFLGSHGPETVARAAHEHQSAIIAGVGGVSLGDGPVRQWLDHRYDFSAVERALATPGGFAETIEVAHTWSRVRSLYDELRSDLAPLADDVFGHFSHVYPQGTSLYVILFGSAADDAAAVARLEEIWSVAMTTARRHEAVLSHHHGAGIARLPYLAEAMGSSHDLLRRVKRALDPDGMLNPGKLALGEGSR